MNFQQSNLTKVIEQLERGSLPVELTFTNKSNVLDEELIRKIQYNSFHRFDYWADKFPPGFGCIPGFDDIIQHMADSCISPIEEIEKRKNILDNDIDDKNTKFTDDSTSEEERYKSI